MRLLPMPLLPLLPLLGALVGVLGAMPATAGAAELSLDRSAVQELLAATIPPTLDVELPGLGNVTLEIGQPTLTDFVDGAVETTLPVVVPTLGLESRLRLRFAPEIEPLYGTPLLRATSARVLAPDSAVQWFRRLRIDLAALLPPAALPRRADWSFALDDSAGSRELAVTCFVQGIVVEPDRLQLELGLRVGALDPATRISQTDHRARPLRRR